MSDHIQIVAAPADTIVLSTGPNGKPIVLNLKETKIAEHSVELIRKANPLNFADLITIFSTAGLELCNAIALIRTALVRIDHKLEYIKADLQVNLVPVLAKQRGMKPTVAEADALITLDPTYSELKLVREEMFNTVEGLSAKYKAINAAYYAIKDVANMKFGGAYGNAKWDLEIPENTEAGTTTRRKYQGEF